MSIEQPDKLPVIEEEKTEGEKKIQEYALRIVDGQNPAYVLDGLPETWVQKVNEIVDGELSVSLENVPAQYRGMSGEALEFIWAGHTAERSNCDAWEFRRRCEACIGSC